MKLTLDSVHVGVLLCFNCDEEVSRGKCVSTLKIIGARINRKMNPSLLNVSVGRCKHVTFVAVNHL